MKEAARPTLVGINHVALEVGNIDEALAFYGKIFAFKLRGRDPDAAFIDMGDQFLALTLGSAHGGVEQRHFGLVVDDRSTVRARAEEAGARMIEGPFLDFLDPWGNRIEVIEYAGIQFTKAPNVLRAMGLKLSKNEAARRELAEKGMLETETAGTVR